MKSAQNITSESLKAYSNSIGVNKIGWFDASNFPKYLKAIDERRELYNFQYKSFEQFLSAGYSGSQYNTIIVLVVDYFFDNNYTKDDFKISNYTRFCWQTIEPKADLIINYLEDRGYRSERANTPDRAAACKAGLGFIGKNCMFYAYDIGSYVGIRTIGTDFKFDENNEHDEQAVNSFCAKCNKCVNVCPTQCINNEGYKINPTKCISFINRHAEEPSKIYPDDINQLGGWLQGCEICQDICPLNANIKHKKQVTFSKGIDLYGMKLKNRNSISKNKLIEKMKEVNSLEYKRYIGEYLLELKEQK